MCLSMQTLDLLQLTNCPHTTKAKELSILSLMTHIFQLSSCPFFHALMHV